MENIISISAVHAPTPSSPQSLARTSSSSMPFSASISNRPSRIFCAADFMYETFLNDIPNFFISSGGMAAIISGVILPTVPRILSHIVSCTFVDICCPTMQFASASKRSGMTRLLTRPIFSTASAILGSAFFRCAISAAPYLKYSSIYLKFAGAKTARG